MSEDEHISVKQSVFNINKPLVVSEFEVHSTRGSDVSNSFSSLTTDFNTGNQYERLEAMLSLNYSGSEDQSQNRILVESSFSSL